MRTVVLVGVAMMVVPLAVAVADPLVPEPGVFLIPDVASLPPDHFTFESPDGGPGGCMDHEREAGAARCLRFTTYLANVGEGRLDLGLAGAGKGLIQRIHATDRSWQERPAGVAERHAVHDHYHVEGLVAFTLHAVDDDGEASSQATVAGGKTGFCLFDGFRGEGPGPVEARRYGRWNCKALEKPGVGMGITPGWVDRYNWTLADQYLEVSGVPDGLYRLDVVADPGALILESSRSNNQVSVLLRLQGDRVEVVAGLPRDRQSA